MFVFNIDSNNNSMNLFNWLCFSSDCFLGISLCFSSNDQKSDDNSSDTDSDQYATIKRCPKDTKKTPVTVTPKTKTEDKSNKENENSPEKTLISQPEKVVGNEKEKFTEKTQIEQIADQQYIDEYIFALNNAGYKARALYDYQAGTFLWKVLFKNIFWCFEILRTKA